MPRLRFFYCCILLLAGSLLAFSFAQTAAQTEILVKPGDTLWGLAQRHGTTPQAILEANGLSGTDLFPGAILKLPAEANAAPETYAVQTGDTLYDIAIAFGVPLDRLVAINGFDGATIRPGQVIRVRAAPDAPPPAPLVVTVKAGDTLWAIAREHDVSLAALESANSIQAARLQPGDQLVIPNRYAPSGADQGGTTPPTVQVGRGDTLWDIARRYNTTVTALMSANELPSQNIQVGQVLRIVPGSELLRATPMTTPERAQPSAAFMVWPLVGPITSRFGYRQLRISGSNFHAGLDIDGNTGDAIVAAAAGVVTYSGWRGGYGNLVVIEASGHEYYYAHASQLVVTVGQAVSAGQLIARVGSTGASTGPHLHFEIRVDGAPVDPLLMLEQHAARP